MAFNRIIMSDEYLQNAYVEQRKTLRQIADEVGCTAPTILHRLRKMGIETRKCNDYPATEKVRETWQRIGKKHKGKVLSEATKQAISKARIGMRLKDNYEFGGHEKQRTDGYISVYCPQHPNSNKDGYMLKHRLVMELHIGATIPRGYIVHHKNGKKNDNRVENLELMTIDEHTSYHAKQRGKK